MTHSYDTTWLVYIIWNAWLMYVKWLIIHTPSRIHAGSSSIDASNMTHSYIWHHAWMYVVCFIHIYDVTHWCMWGDSFIHVTGLMNVCDMTHSHMTVVRQVSILYVILRMRHVTSILHVNIICNIETQYYMQYWVMRTTVMCEWLNIICNIENASFRMYGWVM